MKMSSDDDNFDFVVNPDEIEHQESDDVENMEDLQNEEFEALNARLDQLNQILDTLERKNDIIRAELVELLETNRRTRQQFQKSNEVEDSPGKEE